MTSTRYLEIADLLAAELAGRARGDRVASEPELACRFGVGRAAARSALQELERRLLVRRVRGAGTFVNRPIDYRISRRTPPSWHSTVTAAGGTPRSQVRSVECTPLPGGPARLLRRPVGTPAWQVARAYFLDNLLCSWTEEWIPRDVAPDLELGLQAVESIDLVLRQMGRVNPVRAWCRVSVELPPPHVRAGLLIEPSTSVWLVESLSRDGDTGPAVMCSSGWSRTDALRVVVEMGEPVETDEAGEAVETGEPA